MSKKQVKAKPISNNQGWLFKSIVFLGILLMTIGIFGALFTGETPLSEESETINFIWFFDMIKKYSVATTTLQSTYQTCSYISIILFFLAIISTILPLLIMLLKKSDINIKKIFAFASIGSLIYLFANTLFWSQYNSIKILEYEYSQGVVFGWGSVLIIVGFSISFIGLVLHELFVSKTFISLRNIFAKVGLLFIFFIAIFSGFSVCASIKGEYGFVETLDFSLFMVMGTSDSETMIGLGLPTIIFSLASIVFLALALYKFACNNPEKKGNSVIVFSALFWISSLISNILSLNYFKEAEKQIIEDYGLSVGLGSGAIVEIVLGLGIVAAAILTRVFRKTDKEIA